MQNIKTNIIRGFFIYSIGDFIGQLILGTPSIVRTMGIGMIGASFYAIEIPLWFKFINSRTTAEGKTNSFYRTLLALAYFNPIWITRHLFFIELFLRFGNGIIIGNPVTLFLNLLPIGTKSFLGNILLSLVGNYVVQNKISLKHRFTGSAIFSGICAIWYAVSKTLFK